MKKKQHIPERNLKQRADNLLATEKIRLAISLEILMTRPLQNHHKVCLELFRQSVQDFF